MPLSAITVQNLLRIKYTVSGYQHRADLWIPSVNIVGAPSSSTVSLASGFSSGVTLAVIQGIISAALKAVIKTTDSIDIYALFAVSTGPFLLTPLYSETPAVAGTGSASGVLGASSRFVMKFGNSKGTIVLNELNNLSAPSRQPVPTLGGTDIWSKFWYWHAGVQYFSLKNGDIPTAVYHVSHQFNRKLLAIRNLR
jgi:hypothetical protein